MGGEVLRLNIGRQEALKRLSSCCRTVPFGNDAVIVTDKKDINQGFGTVYFEDGKVSGIAADKNWSPEPVVLQVSNADKFVAERLSCVLRLPNRKGCR